MPSQIHYKHNKIWFQKSSWMCYLAEYEVFIHNFLIANCMFFIVIIVTDDTQITHFCFVSDIPNTAGNYKSWQTLKKLRICTMF